MKDNVVVNATRDQIEEFRKSILWKDLKRELESWSQAFNSELLSIVDDAKTDNPSTASVLLHMGDINGRQKAVAYFLALPDVFLSILKDRADDKKDR
jgi:hypothetical protein